MFRVSPELAMDLTNEILDQLQRERSTGLSKEIQVTLFLNKHKLLTLLIQCIQARPQRCSSLGANYF